MTVWKLSAELPKVEAEAALAGQSARDDWDCDIVVSASEIDERRPDDWVFEAWLPREPGDDDREAIASLFARSLDWSCEALDDRDWVTESQKGVDPIREGRFHVHTPDHAADRDAVDFVIPASQAFGTGQHETTAGCLAMLDRMEREAVPVASHADIGTGTGLLAFAAMRLWPDALATASDIDPVCGNVVRDNARSNAVPLGDGPGELWFTVADGVADPDLARRGPFDLLIANILAGPLIDMAEGFVAATAPGGQILLAGLLQTQEEAVRAAYERDGCVLKARLARGDWSILWLHRIR